jgi:hypothetical protein
MLKSETMLNWIAWANCSAEKKLINMKTYGQDCVVATA